MTSAQSRLQDWADVILADFQTVISHYLQNISTEFFCAAERMLRTIIMQIFRLIQAFFVAKSSRFKLTDFASVMTDDVGCSGRHQCTQCFACPQNIFAYCTIFQQAQVNACILHIPYKAACGLALRRARSSTAMVLISSFRSTPDLAPMRLVKHSNTVSIVRFIYFIHAWYFSINLCYADRMMHYAWCILRRHITIRQPSRYLIWYYPIINYTLGNSHRRNFNRTINKCCLQIVSDLFPILLPNDDIDSLMQHKKS